MSAAPVLDPLRFPLHGSRLIEASAGTGKTWTIAALYLRLVLGHGGEGTAYPRPLLPPEILVMTFTEAATLELRDRIRSRLSQAARCFRGQEAADDYLAALLAGYPEADHAGCARRLEVAAEWMDEAAVFTIHGWCNRMLRQHAFDSGSLFELELDATDTELVGEVARDYWRTFFYPAEPSVCAAVARLWEGPDTLLARIAGLLADGDSRWLAGDREIAAITDPCGPLRELAAWLERVAALEQAAREAWLAGRGELEASLREASASGWLNGTSYPKAGFEARLQAVAAWAAGRGDCKPGWLEGFGQSRIKMNGKFQDRRPRHPALQALDALCDARGDEPQVELEILVHAAGWVRQRFAAEKRRRARLDFDDLLVQLGQALRRDGGERLAELIRSRYPVALIDEFQDTDPLQYGIFDAVYRIGENRPELGLFLIGDPKQSLYAFRGADIHSYLRARRATTGRHYTLERNFRSTAGLIEAVNRVFRRAEAYPGGAFRFRGEADDPLPYVEVRARGRAERLAVEGRPVPALTLWHLPGESDGACVGVGDYRRAMAEATAAAMARLLNLAGRGQAGFSGGSGLVPLHPADLAVLVRDRTEAQAVREALSRCRLRSVYLSDRESVLDSREAADLLLWLEACAEPEQDRKLRAALASATLDLGYGRLDQLGRDELLWEAEVERFRGYQSCWRSQGVLPMVRRLLADFQVPARLLRLEQGERRLTNLLHLAELLQAAAGQLDGEQALVRHLAESLVAADRAADEMLLRLESDADLIKVVTIHKSKGLEYPLVFVPFVCSFREVDGKNSPWYRYHGLDGERRIDLARSDAARQAADAERLQEELRLVYVAMTRARHACWLGIAPLKVGNAKACALPRTAIGHLLAGGAPIEPERLGGLLAELQGGCAAIAVEPPPQPGEAYRPPSADAALEPARRYQGRPAERWRVGSYSALPLDLEGEAVAPAGDAPDTPDQAKLQEEEGLGELPALPLAARTAATLHAFPCGSRPGTFLHGLLEWAAETGFERVAADAALRTDAIARRCQRRSWSHWIPVLDRWLADFLGEPLALPEGPLRLRDLALGQYRAELEFWLAAETVDYPALDRLVNAHILPGQPRPALLPGQLNGMLKGYIDLAFNHGGRYYLADYKSNRLGPDAGAYTADAIRDAILVKRYDLQYALYLLALHRQLQVRLAGYDYDRDLGGAAYLFLRAGAAGLYLDKPPRALIEGLDRLFGGGRDGRDAETAFEDGHDSLSPRAEGCTQPGKPVISTPLPGGEGQG